MREQEPPQRDAGPEAARHVPDARGRRVPVRDEEGDDPARDGDLGALVAEDEEGAEDGGFVGEGGFEGGGGGVGEGGEEGVEGLGVRFVGAEGEEGEEEVGEGDGQGDEVEGGPGAVVGDEGGGHEGADGGADAVGAVEAAEGGGRVGEVGAEDVVGGQVGGDAEAEEEKGDDDGGEGRPADEHDVRGHHDGFRQDEGPGAAEAGLQGLGDGRGGDEAEGVGDEDERDDGVADLVVLFHVGEEGAGGGVVEAVAKVHEAGAQEAPLVDRGVRPGLHDFGGVVGFRTRRAGHFQFPWRLGTRHWCGW